MRVRLVYVSGGRDFLLFEVDGMTPYEPRFDGRSAADWLLDAEHFERMADQLKGKRKLSRSFRELAAEARRKAASLG